MSDDIKNYDRYFSVEILERNGDMEYNDKTSLFVKAGESLQRATEELHLNHRSQLDENWKESFQTWEEYYESEIDESQDGAYWSDCSLIFFPSTKETPKADIETKEEIESWWSSSRCNYADMFNTAESYLKEAAKYLAIEKGIEPSEAMEQVLYALQS